MTDKLDKFLDENNIPEPSENARKTALNMVSTEFESYHKEKNQKKSQGFFNLSRLMGKTNSQDRRMKMKNRKLFYGGMATAMVVVLAGGAALYQTRTHDFVTGASRDAANIIGTAESKGQASKVIQLQGLNTARTVGGGVSSSGSKPRKTPTTEEVTPSMRAAINEFNEEGEEEANLTGESFIPAPSELKKEGVDSLLKNLAEGEAVADSAQALSAPVPELAERRAIAPQASQTVPSSIAGNMVMMESDMIAPVQPIAPPSMPEPLPPEKVDNDKFEDHKISSIKQVSEEPVSTFSVDVDTASYSFVRRLLNNGMLPNPDAVRIEEMVNYFPYDYEGPRDAKTPFNANVAVVDSPWKEGNKLIHIGIKGYDIDKDEQPRSNLVFLLDVSGSMNSHDKLPLLKNSFKLLLNTLKPDDTISIVTYAGRAGTALEPTKVRDKNKILNALESLRAGGSTAGAAGIQGAYSLAEQNFDKDGVNRIILATDGDFNVGASSNEELKELIEKKRESGIFLSVLGFGQGNLNDHLMQTLAQNGNGIAAHIDSLSEAQKVLVDEATSSLFPIAKDVKLQVEFNPEIVSEYRLIGYETRELARQDFNNDKVDAGDIGAGHTVTAIYEIVPKGSGNELYGQSRYEKTEETQMNSDFSNEYAFLKMRYKLPNEDKSTLVTTPISTANEKWKECPPCPKDGLIVCAACNPVIDNDTRFSIAVAGFGQLLKDDKYMADFDYDDVLELAKDGKGDDPYGYRTEFMNLVRLAKTLDDNQ